MTKLRVSVLTSVFNVEKLIGTTIESVLHQTFSDFEFLILDDESSDKSYEVCQSYAQKDNRIQLFASEGKKRGPYGGLNFLLAKATGDYIAIQDHDDLRHPEKLAKQIKFLETHPELVGCGTKTLMRYESDHRGFEYFLGSLTTQALHPSLMFRSSPVIARDEMTKQTTSITHSELDSESSKNIRYPSTVYMNDALFQKKVLCKSKKLIGNLDETLTFHRIRSGEKNYSYSWFKFTKQNIQTIFYLHPLWYACFALGWEIMRKMVYPVLRQIKQGNLIDKIERLPFVLMGKKVEKYGVKRVGEMGFNL